VQTDSTSLPPWPQRLGGRWAVSWQAYGIGIALNVPLLMLTGGSIGAEPVSPSDIPRWGVVGLVAAAGVALWVVLGNHVFFPRRREHPVPVPAVVAYHLGSGLIFSAAIVEIGPRVGLVPEGSFFEYAVVVGAIGLWFGLTMVLLLDARSRFRERRDQLLTQAVELELTRLEETEATVRLRAAITRQVDDATSDLRTKVDTVLLHLSEPTLGRTEGDDWMHLAADMRASAESTIRPLSHELWRLTSEAFPRPSILDALRQAVLSERFWVIPTLAIVFVGYLRAGTYALGLLPGLLATTLLVLAVGLILMAANTLITRSPRTRLLVVALTFLVIQIIGIGFTMQLSDPALRTQLGGELAGSILGMTIALLAPATVASLNSARDASLQRISMTTDRARARQIAQARQLAGIAREAAQHIHGTVQTRLVSAAGAIEQAAAAEDEELLRLAVAQAAQTLNTPLESAGADDEETLAAAITRSASAWGGLLEVDISIDPTVRGLTGSVAASAGRLVEEALSNAYRHGHAGHVTVQVTPAPSGVAIRIADDGTSGPENPAGVGTALMQQLTAGRVHFTATSEGFIVDAVIGV